MTKKSETENAADNGEEKAAEKAPARKTIRRVRKVASRKPKSSEEENVDPAKEVVTPLVDADQDSESPKRDSSRKRASRAPKAGEERSESRSEQSRDADRESKGDSDREKRKIGRVRKDSSSDSRGADGEEERRGGNERRGRGRGRQTSRPKSEPVNAKALARKAWKLYHADIAEEGIALVDDKAGRHLALRSFDLARIFLEEKARQKRAAGTGKDAARKENGNGREDKKESGED